MRNMKLTDYNLKGFSWFMTIFYFIFAAVIVVISGLEDLQTINSYLLGGMLLISVIFSLVVTFSASVRSNIIKNNSRMISYRLAPVLYLLAFIMVLGDYSKPFDKHNVEALVLAAVIIAVLYIWDILRIKKMRTNKD